MDHWTLRVQRTRLRSCCGERAQQMWMRLERGGFWNGGCRLGRCSGVTTTQWRTLHQRSSAFRLGALQIDGHRCTAGRRGAMPVRELLDIRLAGVNVEDRWIALEKMSASFNWKDCIPAR